MEPARVLKAAQRVFAASGSGTYPWNGPLGERPVADSEKMAALGGECATVTFDSAGRIVTVCGTFKGFLVKLLDPKSLDTLAEYAARAAQWTRRAASRRARDGHLPQYARVLTGLKLPGPKLS